jgi:hypothetical protein
MSTPPTCSGRQLGKGVGISLLKIFSAVRGEGFFGGNRREKIGGKCCDMSHICCD